MIKLVKDRRLKMLKSLRPTPSKVREALFNILQDKIDCARFLDLYAGTGAVGLEALSHGALEVVFVEVSRVYAEKIKEKLMTTGFRRKAKVITKKALSFLADAGLKGDTFDIIFLDPPYHTDEINGALSVIGSSHLLKDDGVVIAEHFVKRQLSHEFGRLRFLRDYKYGDTVLSLYKEFK